jgi:hypothetical protein
MGDDVRSHGAQPIPLYLDSLNDLATRAGLRVSVARIGAREGGGGELAIDWQGPKELLLALGRSCGLLPRSWRFPLHRGAISLPVNASREAPAFLSGTIECHGDEFTLRSRTDLPLGVTNRSGIEVIDFGDQVAYFGSMDGLLSLGVCGGCKFPPSGRLSTHSPWDESSPSPKWAIRRHPSGAFMLWREREEIAAARAAAECARAKELAYERSLADFEHSEIGCHASLKDAAADMVRLWIVSGAGMHFPDFAAQKGLSLPRRTVRVCRADAERLLELMRSIAQWADLAKIERCGGGGRGKVHPDAVARARGDTSFRSFLQAVTSSDTGKDRNRRA